MFCARSKLSDFMSKHISRLAANKSLILGSEPTQHCIQMQSNDYLCLANHPRVQQAQIDILNKNADHNNTSVIMSPVFLQERSLQSSLEKRFAKWVDYDAAVLTQSGWNSNVGLMEIIGSSSLPVYIDRYAHMSLHYGSHVSNAEMHAFKHNDMDSLRGAIADNGPGIIVVDSLYSSIGTVCPLQELVDIANENKCITVVDESHSLGLFGEEGQGIVHELGLTGQVDIITASLAKAFAGRSGLLLMSRKLADCVPYMANALIFSSCLLPQDLASLSETLDIIKDPACNAGRMKLQQNATYLRNGLKGIGYNIASQSQIIALVSGGYETTKTLRNALESNGIFGSVFCPPATPQNGSFVRFSLNINITQDELDRIIEVCKDIREQVDLKNW